MTCRGRRPARAAPGRRLYARPIARVVDVWPSVGRGVVPRRRRRHFSGGCSCRCICCAADRICGLCMGVDQVGDPRWRRVRQEQGGDADDRRCTTLAVPPLVTVPGAARAHASDVHADKSFTFINIRFHARQGAVFVQGCRFGRRRPLGTYRLLPLFGSAETHHANPWMDLYRRETALRDPKKASCRIVNVAGHRRLRGGLVVGRGPDRPRCLSTLRLGDGVDDAALKAVPQFANLRCLNVMRTYAVSDLLRLLPRILQIPLVALSLHVDGPSQNADAVARVLASTPAAATLKVLALSDHAQTERSTFTDSWTGSVRRFPAARPVAGRRRRRADGARRGPVFEGGAGLEPARPAELLGGELRGAPN